jgi:D-alanyl-lipoteichoic acid acyltransferase DltB (MBOAT superfamily)
MGQADAAGTRSRLLWSGIAINLVILALMKYLPFLLASRGFPAAIFGMADGARPLGTLLAIGVSYYVFQAISYLVDIYLELAEPEEHFGHFALYLAFFPKLLQGPIERAGDLLPQLKGKLELDFFSGLPLFLWGLFKKVVIADRIAIYVNAVYNNAEHHSGLSLLLATYVYAVQIYCDFSGYTDMALGTAKMLGINLTQNFNRPYFATSIADFWRRWHISFSRWILDYIFKPLQMQWREGRNWGTAAALLVTFLVSGIWHGASWGFVVWGLLHGLYLACSVFYRPYQKMLHKALGIEKTGLLKAWQMFVTFNLASFAWIFFRADSLGGAWMILEKILNPTGPLYIDDSLQILQSIFPAACLVLFEFKQELFTPWRWPQPGEFAARELLACVVLTIATILLGVFDGSQFTSFQF